MNIKSIRSMLVTLVIMGLLLFGQVGTAAAVKPIREPLSPQAFVIEGICSFDVLLEDLVNKEVVTTFFDKEGNVRMELITGALKIRLTNLSTGESLDLNIPGPGRIVPHPDNSSTLIATGPWAIFLFPEDLPDFQPRFYFTSGRQVLEFDADGNLVQLSIVGGHLVDLCAELSN